MRQFWRKLAFYLRGDWRVHEDYFATLRSLDRVQGLFNALDKGLDRQRLIDTIRAAVPDDSDCVQYQDVCPHPIHLAGSVDGVVTDIYADVEGLVDLILKEVYTYVSEQGPGGAMGPGPGDRPAPPRHVPEG